MLRFAGIILTAAMCIVTGTAADGNTNTLAIPDPLAANFTVLPTANEGANNNYLCTVTMNLKPTTGVTLVGSKTDGTILVYKLDNEGKVIANSAVEFIFAADADYDSTNQLLQAKTKKKKTTDGSEDFPGFDEGDYSIVVTCKVKTGEAPSVATFSKRFTVARVPKKTNESISG